MDFVQVKYVFQKRTELNQRFQKLKDDVFNHEELAEVHSNRLTVSEEHVSQ